MNDQMFDALLFGANPLDRIVAVEPNTDTGLVTLWRRDENGIVEAPFTLPFVPWLLPDRESSFAGAQATRLTGDSGHTWRIDFACSGWRGFLDARRELRDEHYAVLSYTSPAKQFLMASGITLFKGMAFGDVRRMQIDIETTGLSPRAPDARIFMVSVCSSHGEGDVFADDDERTLLERLVATVRAWDPDVIEGHNFFAFDMPYIMARCSALGVPCAFGRGGEIPVIGQAERNVAIGPNSRPFPPCHVHGRHVLDTYLQVQRFDTARGQISSYGLKECARVYGIAPPDRVYLDTREITTIFAADPERVKQYALQDALETCALSALVSPCEFYSAQMTPDTYQNIALTGTGEKLNSILLREYLRQGVAVPFPRQSGAFAGGYTEIRMSGVVSPVVKADVESLYPSLMLSRDIRPESEVLGIFLPLLSELTKRRLEAKAMSKSMAEGSPDYEYWDGLQNSFKILINSFYGYIGGPFPFNDYHAANAVTEGGREIVRHIAALLEAAGSKVIEIDTDGVYFQPPPAVRTVAAEQAYIEEIGKSLPPAIRLAHDGSYRSMLSLKIKNYVLEHQDGRLVFKGSSLRSRADEAFGRKFLRQAVELLLARDHDKLSALYQSTMQRIEGGGMMIDEIVRRERVTAKMLTSEARRKAADALRETNTREGEYVHLYRQNGGTLCRRETYAADEDREYYCTKLHKFAMRLLPAFESAEFDRLFPKYIPIAKRPDPAQGVMDF